MLGHKVSRCFNEHLIVWGCSDADVSAAFVSSSAGLHGGRVDTSPDRHFRSRERSAPSAQPAAAGEPASDRLAPPARRPQLGCSPHSAIRWLPEYGDGLVARLE